VRKRQMQALAEGSPYSRYACREDLNYNLSFTRGRKEFLPMLNVQELNGVPRRSLSHDGLDGSSEQWFFTQCADLLAGTHIGMTMLDSMRLGVTLQP
jgi:hypothetical protein